MIYLSEIFIIFINKNFITHLLLVIFHWSINRDTNHTMRCDMMQFYVTAAINVCLYKVSSGC